jgi:hypothetical protein
LTISATGWAGPGTPGVGLERRARVGEERRHVAATSSRRQGILKAAAGELRTLGADIPRTETLAAELEAEQGGFSSAMAPVTMKSALRQRQCSAQPQWQGEEAGN